MTRGANPARTVKLPLTAGPEVAMPWRVLCAAEIPGVCSGRAQIRRIRTDSTRWSSPLRRMTVARSRLGWMFSSRLGPLTVSQTSPATKVAWSAVRPA